MSRIKEVFGCDERRQFHADSLRRGIDCKNFGQSVKDMFDDVAILLD